MVVLELLFSCSLSSPPLTHSEATDVFAFGVTLWEIFSWGARPFPYWSNEEVYSKVMLGTRLLAPDNCPLGVFGLMQACWGAPSSRPKFRSIALELGTLQTTEVSTRFSVSISLSLFLRLPLCSRAIACCCLHHHSHQRYPTI
jgi:hypothetical protein